MNRTKSMRTKKSKVKAKRGKRCQYRPFPYLKVARMWQKRMSISQIAHAINRVDKGNPNDPFHSLRNFLRRMHAGYVNEKGRVVKLPHRVSPSTVRAARKAGLRAAA